MPLDEQEFQEMFMDPEVLNEPPTTDDANDFGEKLNEAYFEARSIFSRLRAQYRGDTWMSNEMWAICCTLEQAYDRMDALCASGGIPDPSELTPQQNEAANARAMYGPYYTPGQ